jgi:LETM1 and EF-hand domain-containing protein 1
MRLELQQWLDLHLEHKVPSSLLLLSNAFQTTSRPFHTGTLEDKAEALQQTLSSLPHQVINEASLKVSQEEGVATNKQKLDVLKEQEEMIEDEEEQELLISNIKKLKEEEAKKKDEDTKKKTLEMDKKEEAPVTAKELVQEVKKEEPIPASTTLESEEVVVDVKALDLEDLEGDLSEEEQKKLSDALKTMSTDSAITDVKETFHSLKEERQDFIEVRIINIGCRRIQTIYSKRHSNPI